MGIPKVLAATGHRPNKLGGYGVDAFDVLVEVAEVYLDDNAPEKVISGMALGWDTAWAQAALNLGIPVIAAIPFKGQEGMWPAASQRNYHTILNKCRESIYVCEAGYAPWKMQTRNQWMVDNCTTLIALWDGSDGGTGNCIKYAEKIKKPIINLWEQFEALKQ